MAAALRRRLRLDQVWLLVSPGNPLKSPLDMAPLAARLASAARLADGRRIVASAIEAQLGTRYARDTVRALRRRFPRIRFVWLMGSDSWAELPRWRRWQDLVRRVPIAVHARPGTDRAALAALPTYRLRHARATPATLVGQAAPRWAFLPLARFAHSATALRAAGLGLNTGSDAPAAKE